MASVEMRGRVRSRDPESSWDAAALQTPDRVSLVRAVIVDLLSTYGPMTDEQIVDRYDVAVFMSNAPAASPQNVRTTRKGLQLGGLVVDTHRRGRTRLGNTAAIWAIAPQEVG